MSTTSSLKEICENCEIVFQGETIAKEGILAAYSQFLLSSLDGEGSKVCVSLHTGSLCFDIMLVIYLTLLCINKDDTTVDDIIHTMEVESPVIYGKSRAIFKGLDEKGYAIIYQEIIDHGHVCSATTFLSPKSFYKIKPYKGSSKRLDGRGLRAGTTERSKFIEAILNKDEEEISAITQKSVIIITNRDIADNLVRGLSLKYNDGKNSIKLTRLVTASYFTEGDEYRYPGNSGRNDAALKFMNKPSLARELIIGDEEKSIIGIAVIGKEIYNSGRTELTSLLKRKSILFSCISYPIELDNTRGLVDDFEDAELFACTSQLLKLYSISEVQEGKLLSKLNQEILTALNKKILIRLINGSETWDVYSVKQSINFLKNNCNDDENIEQFIIYGYSLLNLFSTAIFPIKTMEYMIETNSLACKSPKIILEILDETALRYTGIVSDKMKYIIDKLKQIYFSIYNENMKSDELITAFKYSSPEKKWAVVVPKVYYKNIFEKLIFEKTKRKYNCYIETATKFDTTQNYDEIIIIGQLFGKNFNVFFNLSTNIFTILQYEFENHQYNYKLAAFHKLEKIYNDRMNLVLESNDNNVDSDTKLDLDKQKLLDDSLQAFIENISLKNVLQTASLLRAEATNIMQSDIFRIAKCVNGETIFFTKYFIPYIVNYNTSNISESEVSELAVGDILIFNKNNGESQDIVDDVLLGLIDRKNEAGRFLFNQYEDSKHWKKVLKKYMIDNNLSFKDISNEMKQNGIQKHEVTLRTWLNEDSHIIGPRDVESFYQIALICNEKSMLDSPERFYDACKYIRTTRIKILKALGNAVVKNFIKSDESDEFYDYIAPKIHEISQVVQIETIIDAEDIRIPAYMANKPQYI